MTKCTPFHIVALLCAGLAGCGTRAGVATRPVQPLDDLKQGEGATGIGPARPMTIGQLRVLLMAHADRTIAALERVGGPGRTPDSAPEARLALQLWRTSVASAAVGLAVEPDAGAALLDLMVSTAVQHQVASRAVFPGAGGEALVAALAELEQSAWAIGARVHPAEQRAQLRSRAEHFAQSAELGPTQGLVRLADLPPAPGPALAGAKGLFAPLDEANRQIEETRLLGERLLFLTERLPLLSRWQAETFTAGALGTPESRQALAGLSLMASGVARMGTQVESLPVILDRQRQSLLADLDAREGTLRQLLREASRLAEQGRAAAESGERVMALSDRTAASLGRTILAVNQLLAALRDSTAPGGAVDLNVAHYAATVGDLRAALEALNSALGHGDGIAGGSRSLVDHLAWRAAQLILLLFALLLGYRFLAQRMTRREP
jgi:hypothetical protein